MSTQDTLDFSAEEKLALIQLLAERLSWVAPIGHYQHGGTADLRGFMVCRRVVNNVDGKNTRVDYLRVDGSWKSPFRETECTYPTLASALTAAARRIVPSVVLNFVERVSK